MNVNISLFRKKERVWGRNIFFVFTFFLDGLRVTRSRIEREKRKKVIFQIGANLFWFCRCWHNRIWRGTNHSNTSVKLQNIDTKVWVKQCQDTMRCKQGHRNYVQWWQRHKTKLFSISMIQKKNQRRKKPRIIMDDSMDLQNLTRDNQNQRKIYGRTRSSKRVIILNDRFTWKQ